MSQETSPTAAPAETHAFQAEVRQLLDIVVHSLYSEREIFVRELISNASDALEKLRHLQVTGAALFDDGLPLEIRLTTDENAGVFTIQDFGIGLNRSELVQNLGTIAHSGSKQFVQAMKAAAEQGATPAQLTLIGQFGVGFYSAFMVAKEVKVYTRSYSPEGEQLVWSSDGGGAYTIEPTEGQRRGARIVVQLKDDAREFAQEWRVKEIIKKYSSFVPFPVLLNGEKVNTVTALWTKQKSEIKDEEYTEFYRFQANAFDTPIYRLHFSADAPLAIQSLLFVPEENPERWGFGRAEPGVGLYCKKVLIDPKPEHLLPEWLRFLRGVVDSADLPLNVSREMMQDSALIKKLGDILTKRFIKFLSEEAEKRPDGYNTFYDKYAIFLKEGAATDAPHRDGIAKLLRYESSATEAGKRTSLAEYVGRMGTEQKEIYYLFAPTRAAIESGPYLEALKARGLEVLFLYEPVDEFVVSHVREFDGKKLVAADSDDLKLSDLPPPAESTSLTEAETTELTGWLKEQLGSTVKEVKGSARLTDSPVVALNADKMMTPAMRRMMKAMRPNDPSASEAPEVVLEINPRHALIRKLHALRTSQPEVAALTAQQLASNALLAAGLVDDPRTLVPRLNQLLEKLVERS